MTQQNITPEEVEHVLETALRERGSVTSTHHNISSGLHARHITLPGVLGRCTGVLIVDLAQKVLRQNMVQPALRRSQPFYPRVSLPALLERRHLFALNLGQIERPAVAEVKPRPHAPSLADGGAA